VSPRGCNALTPARQPPKLDPPPELPELSTDQPVGKLEIDSAFAWSCDLAEAPAGTAPADNSNVTRATDRHQATLFMAEGYAQPVPVG
jgi:hypothetical protein